MKKLTTSILLAVFSATIFTPAPAEASWLSKTLGKVVDTLLGPEPEATESQSSSVKIPTKWDYPAEYNSRQRVGHKLEPIEYQVLGVPIGANFTQVKASLGAPTAYEKGGLRYGGVRNIILTNRDATTHRGIAVGDTLEKVYKAYGRATHIYRNDNGWFYGYFMWDADAEDGIYFENDGTRVTKISIISDERR